MRTRPPAHGLIVIARRRGISGPPTDSSTPRAQHCAQDDPHLEHRERRHRADVAATIKAPELPEATPQTRLRASWNNRGRFHALVEINARLPGQVEDALVACWARSAPSAG
jgi:hypothetical protein